MDLKNNNLSPICEDPGHEERLARIMLEFKNGFCFLKQFDADRVVTIFGSSGAVNQDPWYQQAEELGRMLAKAGFTVVTGGGPGVMEAANKGAAEAGGRTAGLNIELPDTEQRNYYIKEHLLFYYFFVRKVMLAHVAQAYVFFPGGLGTLDEFFELSLLIAKKKIDRKIPMILVGKEYWGSLIDWLKKTPQDAYHAFSSEEFSLWSVVDSAQDALEMIKDIPNYFPRHESL